MTKPSIELNKREFGLARVELLDAWRALEIARDRFISALKADTALPAWCEGHSEDRTAREAASELFADFFYVGEESAKLVRRLVGLVGASRSTIQLARAFNTQKRAFASCITRLQRCIWIDERRERHPLVRTAFQEIKIARINTVQVTRQITVVEPGLRGISWCISCKPRSRQVTREEAIDYIRATLSRRLRLARALVRLERLAPNTVLALYRPGDPLAIANATYLDKWYKPTNRQYTSGMPLLIELTAGEGLPECSPPERDPKKRTPRPSNIERVAFIEALKLHRYREQPARSPNPVRKRDLDQLFRGP